MALQVKKKVTPKVAKVAKVAKVQAPQSPAPSADRAAQLGTPGGGGRRLGGRLIG
jgi:hypothetical protein|tara:strand:+ start:297 stop:461 length:165 start_codon:yes stop_codon:yes gene_type:complete